MEEILNQFFNFGIMQQAWPIMWKGMQMTLILCVAVISLGLIGGLAVALLSIVHNPLVRWITIMIVDFFRAIPPLVLLIFIYSGLPFAGIQLSPFVAVCLAFFLNTSAYYGEVYRAGIESISKGQMDAARSTGLNHVQAMTYVVLPQAVRNVLPDLISNTIEVVKLTSIASVVALTELLYSADMARSITYNTSPIVMAAVMYLIILWPAVRLMARLENKMNG